MKRKVEASREGFESGRNTSTSIQKQSVYKLNFMGDINRDKTRVADEPLEKKFEQPKNCTHENIEFTKKSNLFCGNRKFITLEELCLSLGLEKFLNVLEKISLSEFPYHIQNNKRVFIKTEIEGMLELEQEREQMNQVTNSETKNRRA